MDNNKLDEALEFFEKEITENPKNGYAYVLISSVYEEMNKNSKTIENAELALKYLSKKDKKSLATVYSKRGSAYLKLDDTVSAITDFTTAIKIYPQSPAAYVNRGYVYIDQKKYDLAEADFNKVISLDQGDMSGYMGIGFSRNAQEKWDDAIGQYTHVIRMYPNLTKAYSYRAESYLGKKDWDKAVDDLIFVFKRSVDVKSLKLICRLQDVAFDKIKDKLNILAVVEKNNSIWSFLNGVLHDSKCKYKEAKAYYEEANRREINDLYLSCIACDFYRLGQYEKSIESIDRALNMSPKDKSLLKEKANALYGLGRLNDAIVLLDSALTIDPEYESAYFHRAKNKKYMNDFDGAIDDYTKAINISPKSSYLYSARAYLYDKTGKHDLAKSDYQKVVELEKKSDYDCAYFAYYALGDSIKAIEVMDSILVRDSLIASAYYNAASLYSRMNRIPDALRYLEISLGKGYANFFHISTDFDMDRLRELPEFKALIKKYKNAAKGKDEVSGNKIDLMKEGELPFEVSRCI